ncbi:mechanosensitive ion channel family protein [Marinigracilibium pacificum]|uniref:Mechanosensitive ion channel family protein n=1 Tax=Marinigracilibium pacificum TaxID=2729599 RepID=A0A848IW55_9BACT|nr:mechanosensitive ion channel family protein [Marinigracilibium pacificum]NMM48567.1 mechanosensitive ion channel family protein [Marinigracilibium pacificum]
MYKLFLLILLFISFTSFSQENEESRLSDSTKLVLYQLYQQELTKIRQRKFQDSIMELVIKEQVRNLDLDSNATKSINRSIAINQNDFIEDTLSGIKKYPVIGILEDTLFYFNQPIGTLSAEERAENLSGKLKDLFKDDYFVIDSLKIMDNGEDLEIYYQNIHLVTITTEDANFHNTTIRKLTNYSLTQIKSDFEKAYKERSLFINLLKAGKVILILIGLWLTIKLIGFVDDKILELVDKHKNTWLRDLKYKNYTFLSRYQELGLINFLIRVIKWILIVLALYISIPLIFSVFTFTRGWADKLINLVWTPFKSIWVSIWSFLPNIFTILAILIVMHYFLKFIKYIFMEIKKEKLTIPGFYPDWAKPTYGIIKFLMFAFTIILIFPYLPGSDSKIFQGVSVFVGILFSLGSTNAVSNMVAGIVITYMRPFKKGDRVKVGSVTGDIIEKNLLVTRINSIKNEVVTIPNATILSGNILNYNILGSESGLIIHTTVTIGYDVPWKKVHEALKEAAIRTEPILKDPEPFVFQTELSDFYVAYQLNAYTTEPNKQAAIYSSLHSNIQDVFKEYDIEIMSPHFRANRDGNSSTIPEDYIGIPHGKKSKQSKIKKETESSDQVLGDRGQAIEQKIDDVTKNMDEDQNMDESDENSKDESSGDKKK